MGRWKKRRAAKTGLKRNPIDVVSYLKIQIRLQGKILMDGESQPLAGPGGAMIQADARPLLETPVSLDNRIDTIDILRGIALLGILVINAGMFGLPQIAISNPQLVGYDSGADLAVWAISRVYFFQKFMAIFAMLFGAGLILMYQRAEDSGRVMGKTYYRRLRWLLVFGLIHAYLIWWGDILFHYAVSGMLLYPLRRWSPRRLIILGIIVFFVGSLFFFGLGLFLDFCRATAAEGEAAIAAGEQPTELQQSMIGVWENIQDGLLPSQEKIAKEIELYRGNYLQIISGAAPAVVSLQTFIFLFYIIWRVTGCMLVGMGLMKLGVLAGRSSPHAYRIAMIAGYAVGLPLIGYITYRMIAGGFDFKYMLGFYTLYDHIGIIFITAGHIGLFMLICQSNILTALKKRLAAVGRMAFSNYLMHSVIMAFIFYGYGMGQYARIGYFGLMGIVAGIWIIQLYLSPWWLSRFRFGPLEWVWRSLTYRKKQPMRI